MTIKFDKKGLTNLMRTENERILDLLLTYNVPESIEDVDLDNYLLKDDKNVNRKEENQRGAVEINELQERLNTIKNKMKAKKRPISDRAKKKRDDKKLKKNKEFKKILVSAAKSIKNENQKIANAANTGNNEDKKNIELIEPKPIFNQEGKIVFSKIDFSSHLGAKVKKSHQNAKEILKHMKETDKKVNELKEKGDFDKAAEIKNEIAWKNAFEKTEGKKVKDDPKLLYKTVKKRKIEKKKAKKQWSDRKKKVESGIDQRQKKREQNINKRIKDKKNKKLKTMSRKGRVIPGF